MLVTLAVIGLLLVLLGLWLTGALKAPARKERAVVEKTEAQGTPTPGVVKTLESVPAPIVGSVATTPPSKSSAPTVVTEPREFISPTNGTKFVRIKAGTFTMGSPDSEAGRSKLEVAHEVKLTRDYYLGIHEVTRGQLRKFVDETGHKTEAEADGKGGHGKFVDDFRQDAKFTWLTPGFEQTDEHPVVLVSWSDALKYAEWLSRKDGRAYRLPTEVEWENGCRGGVGGSRVFGVGIGGIMTPLDANYGRFDTTRLTKVTSWVGTTAVGSYRANDHGLHDMHGNVWEWCGDWSGIYSAGKAEDPSGPSTGSERVARGGSWLNSSSYCRSANRYQNTPSVRSSVLGFRLALTPLSP